MGFRSFDLDVLAEHGSSDRPPAAAQPFDLVARRAAVLAHDAFDADRWSYEGGRVSGEATAEWPAAQ
jgi:hypothetical protein